MRRVVTGHDSKGRSTIVSDGALTRLHEYKSLPGLTSGIAWVTEPGQPVSRQGVDATVDVKSVVPLPGGVTVHVLVIPPDTAMASPEFDAVGFIEEASEHLRGLAELFEPELMHATPTVDYVILVEGEIWMETDGGRVTHLKQGDILVQNGTRHAWRNRSDKPAVMVVVMVGAPTSDSDS